jgi:hypothetical protein
MKNPVVFPAPPSDPAALQHWLLAIAPIEECCELRGGVHPETYKREAAREGRELLKLSKRRVGDYRWQALRLPNPLGPT